MLMSRHKNAGQNHDIKIGNRCFGNVEQFRYLGTTIINQNPIQEEIKKRLNSRNACYHSVQNLLSSRSQFYLCRTTLRTSVAIQDILFELIANKRNSHDSKATPVVCETIIKVSEELPAFIFRVARRCGQHILPKPL
jgi:hypothetical protein